MKNIFRGFYTPKEEEYQAIWNDEKTLFIFDTNTLLNLYRCEEQTKDDILQVMSEVSSRSWFPFHVCLEYQQNRINTISQSSKSLEVLKKEILSLVNSPDNAVSEAKVKKHLYSSLSNEIGKLKTTLATSINEFVINHIDSRIEAKNQITQSDSIRKALEKIIGINCGEIPSQEKIDTINAEGVIRYLNKLPPGFMDEKTKGENTSQFSNIVFTDKFGDLYLWKEIIDKAKTLDDYNIIFITDDSKKDWWYVHDKKTIGPAEHLQTEIYSNTKIKNFRMLSHPTFLFEANKYLQGLQIHESSVEDIKDLSLILLDEAHSSDDTSRKQDTSNLKKFSSSSLMPLNIRKNKNTKSKDHANNPSIDSIVDLVRFFAKQFENIKTTYTSKVSELDFKLNHESLSHEEYDLELEKLQELEREIFNAFGMIVTMQACISNESTYEIIEGAQILLPEISQKIIFIERIINNLK